MTDEELAEFLKDISPNELWIVNYQNRLQILTCPFLVILKEDILFLRKHQEVYVELVRVTRDLKIVFMVGGTAFYAYHFIIPPAKINK